MSAEHETGTATPPLLRMLGIGKSFGGVRVLRDVDFDLLAGEVHVLAGENGAGKSTLVKILAGEHAEHEGTIELDGVPVRLRSPHDARRRGIAVIYQELSLVEPMSVAENMFLGRELTAAGGMVLRDEQELRAAAALRSFGVEADVRAPVESLPVGLRQLVEIARAVMAEGRIVVMDEPTSALSAAEAERLFATIRRLVARGCGVVYISHRLEEIARIADRITILRDGRKVATAPAAAMPPDEMVRLMVGRPIRQMFPPRERTAGAVRLQVRGFSLSGTGGTPVHDVSFDLRAGEILGIAGLQGSGASELLLALFGAFGAPDAGRVLLDGEPLRIDTPARAIAAGMALLTNDRKATGLVPDMGVGANMTLATVDALSRGGWIDRDAERQAVRDGTAALRIRYADDRQPVAQLSGGNQQKVLLARWLATRPRVLLLDEPTRGVDVGVKAELYALLGRLAAEGTAILLVTSEHGELQAMADRIVGMERGRMQ